MLLHQTLSWWYRIIASIYIASYCVCSGDDPVPIFAGTSDDEFEAEDTAELSDACSDLDAEEGGMAEGGVAEEDSPEATDEEEEDAVQPWPVKRKHVALKMLDSDDEDDSGEGVEGSKGRSDLLAGDEFLVDSSMPPLRLDSFGESYSPDPLSPVQLVVTPSLPTVSQKPSTGLLADSGLGRSLEQEAGLGVARKVVGEGMLEEDSNTTADSLEYSFQWGQSLPLAQLSSGGAVRPRVCRGDSDSTQDMWREESQAVPSGIPLSQFPSQSVEESETQFLDEDG